MISKMCIEINFYVTISIIFIKCANISAISINMFDMTQTCLH